MPQSNVSHNWGTEMTCPFCRSLSVMPIDVNEVQSEGVNGSMYYCQTCKQPFGSSYVCKVEVDTEPKKQDKRQSGKKLSRK